MPKLVPVDPIWTILEYQGRSLRWLAHATDCSESHVKAMKARRFRPNAAFRARSAKVLGIPESMLFVGVGETTAEAVAG